MFFLLYSMTSGYSLDDSALPLTGFHSTTACKGWRDSSLHDAPWQDAIGKQRLFELDTYGTIGAKEYYHAHVQPWLSGGYKNMSFDHFSLINPEGAARCAVEAAAQQEKHGALYVGMKDCVRSMMCDRDGGQACHSQHAHSLCLCHLSSPCLASEPSHRIHFDAAGGSIWCLLRLPLPRPKPGVHQASEDSRLRQALTPRGHDTRRADRAR